MSNLVKLASALLLPILALADGPAAHALQTIEGADGVSVEAILSIKEPTRIKIEGAAIANVFGNIYSSNCGASAAAATSATPQAGGPTTTAPNPGGEIAVECDAEKGEVYVRPVGDSRNPVNLFVSSQFATYTLLLRKSDTPADTIIIRDKSQRMAKADATGAPGGRQPQHVRNLKAMLIAMASDRAPVDIRVEEVNRKVQLWAEADFALTRLYEGRGLIGERYLLTNTSTEVMVLAEQEFDREAGGVLGVAIENHNLRPGESTVVVVIRQGT